MDEVLIQSMAKLHIRPEYNVVQSDTTNDIGRVSFEHLLLHKKQCRMLLTAVH